MPPKKEPAEPIVRLEVGPPIFPHGVVLMLEVPVSHVPASLLELRDLARSLEPLWQLQPHEMPRPDVPGTTTAVDGERGVYGEECNRPGRIGFTARLGAVKSGLDRSAQSAD